MSSINLQESQLSGCEKYIAIVVDESGSISSNEAQQIRGGLTSFINSHSQSNITLSLIGMSNSDTAVRPDNVIQKKIADNKQDFLNWITLFGQGRVTVQSDYWASGLNEVRNLAVTPDIVFVVTDGVQVNNSQFLKDIFTELNLKSQVFVYGVTSEIGSENELTTPLNTFLGRTPKLKSDKLTALDSDYLRVTDFSTLEAELNQLITDLNNAQTGCISNVSIIENKIVYPVLKKGKKVKEAAGTLTLRNKSRIPLTLSAGTRIHQKSSLNGLIFRFQNAVTIPGSAQVDAAILIEGKPLTLGNSTAPIFLDNVKNNAGFSINFNVGKGSAVIDIDNLKTNLQSTYLQIAAAGSRGVDSTKGIHLRWMLTGKLGEKHLPKGDLYTGDILNHNKPDDFVKVYRAPYIKKTHVLDLSEKPNVVDNQKALWIYKPANSTRSIYVTFHNITKYKSVKLAIDPLVNPADFIQAYGNNLIEIENKSELFFAAELNFSSVNTSSKVRLETLSVAENNFIAEKRVSNRKTYSSSQIDNIRLVSENGKSIRLKVDKCLLHSISFEFYSDFITQANTTGDWTLKGKYALSNDDTKVFEQLEPKLNAVHGKWLKYNEDDYVNIANYKHKWNRPTNTSDITDHNIKEILNQYILLSKDINNPTASKDIPFGDRVPVNEPKNGEPQEYAENLTEVSYLDLLNIAANDYHIARMLGLGCIDMDDEVLSGEFVYLTEYTTLGDLDGAGAKERQHLSMSIPTSLNTERQSLPVQLNKIVPGLNMDSDESQTANITDPEGYSFDGKKRYVSLFMDDVMDYDVSEDDKDFFKSPEEYDGSTFTFPVYVGVDYKVEELDDNWVKPELSHDVEYKNVNKNLEESNYESVPIIIPESGKSIINIRQKEVGEKNYIYQGYGINIFSRATTGRQISIKSDIKPANNLMPPSNINSLLITDESPLMFTSASEQERLGKITGTDKTLVRILFDYYSAQELTNYTLPADMSAETAETDVNSIYPDSEEIFADHFKLYYKDGLPEVEYAAIDDIIDNGTDNLTSIVKIKEYKVLSSGQEIKISLTDDNKEKYDGGILTIGDQNYIVKSIEVVTKTVGLDKVFDYALIEVLKKEVSDSVHADGDATIDSDQIKSIQMPENRLCTLVQNMQSSCNWHKPGIDFKVEYPAYLNEIHREVIQPKSNNTKDLQLEKTRGFWKPAVIERVLEKSYEMNADGSYKLDVNEDVIPLAEDDKKHLGLYKITFPGFNLPQHPQYKAGNENSVEWFNGIVRLFRKSSVKAGSTIHVESRKEFKVVRVEKEDLTGDLVLTINDTDFKLGNFIDQTIHPDYDEIIVGNQDVNYYPSYRVYLYADSASGINEQNIQPRANESTHYSIFGISTRAVRPNLKYKSKISIPSPMYAVKIEKPEKPEEVKCESYYATRPDFYNRSTFTFTTRYKKDRKPYGALHYRANEESFLNVLYERETIKTIREELQKLGGNDEVNFRDRWKNFLNFNELKTDGQYKTFPQNDPEGFGFPLPDNEELKNLINDFIKWHNKTQKPVIEALEIDSLTSLNQILILKGEELESDMLAIHFIEEAIQSAFVPLTEVPVIYEHIKGKTYTPTNKKQTIKDKNGHALKPTDTDFDIAPMMKILNETENITQFTDFNLDGNSQSIYFYAVREMDIKMNFSQFSDLLGPVKLVSSTPPKMPEIKRIMPILENQVLGIKPAIQFELNAYLPTSNIKKINIYRAKSMQEAQSIRTMTPVKEVLIDEETLSNEFDNVWTVYDEFEDLESVPFGDGLFYRITVSREIEYEDSSSTELNPIVNIDYAPSQPSKITATIIADNVSPESPVLEASGIETGANGEIFKPVIFSWEKTVHNGKYHLYKMNNQGNWEKIHEKASNEIIVNLPLQETKLGTDQLVIKNEDGERIYHHFKVISENSSGMFSSEEKILTL
ncbi:hypothetical protein SAMN05444671_3886 [Flavobacterium sp. CF108]|uniref:vWA domain-containing protein n=1 Tax=unclassified Flavobacterium TaxID=196869 RepID=UPI0008BF9B83|nr:MULTISPECIES: vWA domain-containing protein [unclassified Flavobacterium]SEO95910.1 hypothetical protein SAMN04487978_4085 [Flavobacterium sp. fv08]SHH81828.1 hypothetical protein SAMN05444671_3886 [Flavobacterium sp. CF108]